MRHIIMLAALCGLSSTAFADPFAGAYVGGQLGGAYGYSDRLTVQNTNIDYNISNASLMLGLNYRF